MTTDAFVGSRRNSTAGRTRPSPRRRRHAQPRPQTPAEGQEQNTRSNTDATTATPPHTCTNHASATSDALDHHHHLRDVAAELPLSSCQAPHPLQRGQGAERVCPLHRCECHRCAPHLTERPKPSRAAKFPSGEKVARSAHSNLLRPHLDRRGCTSAARAATSRKMSWL
jgi:hypothetical protein